MPAYADVFQRVEKKYRLDAARRAALEEGLAAALAPDGYGRACITSLYLDTPERTLIDRSLEKPPYKEKLRLRAYGEPAGRALAAAFAGGAGLAAPAAVSGGAGLAAPAAADLGMPVFLEIKKKFRGVVYKRRVSLSLGAAVAYLDGVPYEEACAARPLADAALQQASLAPRSRQIARELDAALVRHGRLAPSMAFAASAWPGRHATRRRPDRASPLTTAWSSSTSAPTSRRLPAPTARYPSAPMPRRSLAPTAWRLSALPPCRLLPIPPPPWHGIPSSPPPRPSWRSRTPAPTRAGSRPSSPTPAPTPRPSPSTARPISWLRKPCFPPKMALIGVSVRCRPADPLQALAFPQVRFSVSAKIPLKAGKSPPNRPRHRTKTPISAIRARKTGARS